MADVTFDAVELNSTSSGNRTSLVNEPFIDNIEYDQIVVPDKKSWKNLFAYMGPGFLVSIAYIDPETFKLISKQEPSTSTVCFGSYYWHPLQL